MVRRHAIILKSMKIRKRKLQEPLQKVLREIEKKGERRKPLIVGKQNVRLPARETEQEANHE